MIYTTKNSSSAFQLPLILWLFIVCEILVSQASSLSSSRSNSQDLQTTWKDLITSILPVVQDQPTTTSRSRLRVFADAVWDNYCYQRPSHQHLLIQSSSTSSLEDQQKCDTPFPDLHPVQPVHDTTEYSWSHKLESEWKVVLKELNDYLTYLATDEKDDVSDQSGKPKNKETWKTSTTALCQDTRGFTKLTIQDDQGNPTAVGKKHFPKTLSLLHSTVGRDHLAPRPVNINCQAPLTGLAPHSDNMNFILTCHLGLIIPPGAIKTDTCSDHDPVEQPPPQQQQQQQQPTCLFQIGSRRYVWTPGRVVVADTSFVHWTQNNSPTESRYVLAFNIWHPDLTEIERQGIRKIHAALQQVMQCSSNKTKTKKANNNDESS